ncbi:MAG: caspase family protein, partial [Cyanothece sp. SIO1E1]|nr:caspase family protein [Cyanothece sp. SIO1E1]
VDRNGQRIHAISDLELRWLINQVTQSGAHVISAMDCCYSGGNTRNVPDGLTKIKFSEPPQEVNENARPLSSYVFHQVDEEARNRLNSDTPTDFQMPLAPNAVSLQACRDNELAKEASFLEGRFGVFTYFFLQVLNATGGNISYRDLIKLVRTKVKGKAGVSFQSPQIDATDVEDTNLSFLSAEPVLNANHYAVSPINATEAWMDAGTLHGLATLSTGQTHVDIYLHDENIEEADPDKALKGTLTQVQAHLSKIKLEDGATFEDLDNLYKAVITSSPIPATRIRFVAELEGNEMALADLSNNGAGADLATAITQVRNFLPADGADFRFIGEAGPDEGFQFVVKVSDNGGRQEYSITRRDDSVQLNPPLVGFNTNNAETLVAQLVHMARWEKTLKLENEHPHIISPDDVEIEIIDAGAWSVSDVIAFEDAVEVAPAEAERVLSATNGEVELPFRRGDDGKWLAPRIRARIRMKNENRFYYGAFMLISSDFALFTRDYLPDNAMIGERVTEEDGITNTNGKMLWEISPGHFDDITGEFVLREEDPGQPMDFYLTEDQIENGITEIEDHFKLIISTAEFDSRYLEQASISEATGSRAPHNVTPTSQLEEFLREAGRETRAGRRRSNGTNGQKGSDWLSVSLTIRTKLIE